MQDASQVPENAPAQPAEDAGDLELVAYSIAGGLPAEIRPSGRWREWMDATHNRWANRCLPLLVANESGWTLANQRTFTATWSGDDSPESVAIEWEGAPPPVPPVSSHFGYGILTWSVPYVFRTPPGWNLHVRGPVNDPKDGAGPLEGIVETDWSVASFTMNWKLTRPQLTVRFVAGEPFCLVLPQRRAELERFRPRREILNGQPDLAREYAVWTQRRHDLSVRKFLARYSRDHAEAVDEWQADYFKGRTPDGTPAHDHQTKRRLRPFTAPS